MTMVNVNTTKIQSKTKANSVLFLVSSYLKKETRSINISLGY